MKKLTTEEFIRRAREIHGNKFNYDEVIYVNNSTPVKIYCNSCKEYFYQVPSSHLLGFGCKKCGHKEIWNKRHQMSTQEFIEKAIQIHGDKYDYNETIFNKMHDKVKIKCKKCGYVFEQLPYAHLNGQGCPKCKYKTISNKLSLGIKNFVDKARELHGNKYNYSKVEYINNVTPVVIICPIHGEFTQTPANHLNGQGCPKCSHKSSKYTTEEFKNKIQEIYGDLFDLNKVNYTDSKTRVKIYCKKHGYVDVLPSTLLKGKGCPKCGIEERTSKRNLTTKQFIEKAIQIHGDKYDYSKTIYKKTTEKVCIICPEHGEFYMIPNAHLSGQSCPKCGINTRSNKQKLTYDEVVRRAREIHGDKYDYQLISYNNVHDKVTIICPTHGEFKQELSVHLQGFGCSQCNCSRLENLIKTFLDYNHIIYEREYTKNMNKLRLDFYLPEYNIAIECQGKQHFEPVSFSSNCEYKNENFKYTIDCDYRKNKQCLEQNIKILYFTNINLKKYNILNNKVYKGIYTQENVITNQDILLQKIKGEL